MTSLKEKYCDVWSKSQKEGGEKNIFDYFIYRRISTALLLLICNFRFSPNHITTLSVVFSIITAVLLANASNYLILIIAVFMMNLSLVLDTLDGQYSRYTKQPSEFGAWYDSVSDCLKYIFIFIGMSLGCYRYPQIEQHWFGQYLEKYVVYPEYSLIAGMMIIGNLFMIYFIHGTRYHLSINSERLVKFHSGRRSFHFGIESTLYTIFTVFLVFGQSIWLLNFLVAFLPLLWIGPLMMVYLKFKNSQ